MQMYTGSRLTTVILLFFPYGSLGRGHLRSRGVLPYMGYIGMCRCEGYGFQAVYSTIGYINQNIWVEKRVSFFRKLISWLKILSRIGNSYSRIGGIWGVAKFS